VRDWIIVLFIVIGGDFDKTHVRELNRGATCRVCKFSTESGVGDDQVALWKDRHGLSGLNHDTP
jgi:hypothetical protein